MKDESKSRKSPAFMFYADDFLAGTMELSQEEVGQFIRLLCHQWNRGSIPVATEKQQRLTGGCVSVDVLAKFKLYDDGELRNERLEEVRSERDRFLQQQAEKGRKSAELRKQASTAVQPDTQPETNHGSTAVEIRLQPESNSPSPSPSPKEDTNRQKALSPDLEAFRLRIGAMVRRRHDTRWSSKEIKALKEVFELNTPEDDILLVEARYKSKDPYLRRDAMALLNNWNGEVDKVRSGLLPGIGESRVATTSTNIADYQ
jgi:uncharacterized protein YdaU (DUF1376 family)